LLNYVAAVADRLDFVPGARHLMVQPLTVDSSVTMLFGSLLTGGCLHLVTREQASDAYWLASYISEQGIQHLKIAPSHFAALRSAHPHGEFAPRDRLIFGGETSHWDLVSELLEKS